MRFYSTNNPSLRVSFQDAVFNSMPLDRGLYMPAHIKMLDPDFMANIDRFSFQEIAFRVADTLLGDAIPTQVLKDIINDAISFDAPLVALDGHTFVLELFHGPSLAFKDFGARFMSRIMAYFLQDNEKQLDVLVATSGDTGGAVSLGFLGVPNTRVTILFPEGKVSEIQRLQLTTNGKNIRAIAVDGTFDDCQALVKKAFADTELNEKLRLTSANSINIARLIPQTFYYFHAYAQLKRRGLKDIVFAVPSGNFGNLGAGLLAYRMGLPVKQFIAATNANDTVPRFLATGNYEEKPSIQTYANAMDVGAPSNWVRIMELFDRDQIAVQQLVKGYSFTDAETLAAINRIYNSYGYVACPHTAIAWLALEAYVKENPKLQSTNVFLSTAHPCKFPDIFPGNIKKEIKLPAQVDELYQHPEKYEQLGKDFEGFKLYLLSDL
ncbi:MAG: threonine synthase [Pedobacter sp.]|nr:threonine synthase [Pedobacter sp.]MDQ8052965.1 threonine synthase [Pedobacter sp.]